MSDKSMPYVDIALHQEGYKFGDYPPTPQESANLVTQFINAARLRKHPETGTWYVDYFDGTAERTAEVTTRKQTDSGYSLYYKPPFRATGLAINDKTSTGEVVWISIPRRDHFPVRLGFGIDRPFWITKVWLEEGRTEDFQTTATDILIWG